MILFLSYLCCTVINTSFSFFVDVSWDPKEVNLLRNESTNMTFSFSRSKTFNSSIVIELSTIHTSLKNGLNPANFSTKVCLAWVYMELPELLGTTCRFLIFVVQMTVISLMSLLTTYKWILHHQFNIQCKLWWLEVSWLYYWEWAV